VLQGGAGLGVHRAVRGQKSEDRRPRSKAEFLDRESRKPGGLASVIKETQISRAAARRFLLPYRLLKSAGVKFPKGEDFYTVGEALQRTGVQKFLQLEIDSVELTVKSYDKANLTLLLSYLYGPETIGGARDASKRIVHDTRGLSRLAAVLSSPPAEAALRAGKTLEIAEIYVDTREESLKRLGKMTKSLGLLVKKLTAGKGQRAREGRKLAEAFKAFEAESTRYLNQEK
jgi:hypothetical protein